jgi:hypothetical protein
MMSADDVQNLAYFENVTVSVRHGESDGGRTLG